MRIDVFFNLLQLPRIRRAFAINKLADDYRKLTEDAAQVLVTNRAWLEVSGRDRAQVLHNFCTGDIKRCEPGQGVEAFVLDVKGKTINHGFFFVNDDSILVDSVQQTDDALPSIEQHVDRYVIGEKVRFVDRTSDFATIFVCGSQSFQKLGAMVDHEIPPNRNDHRMTRLGGIDVRLLNISSFGPPGIALVHSGEQTESLQSVLEEAGIGNASRDALEILRVECGMPQFGTDFSASNLPQEVGRDKEAISFEKGCYLGQETVARIDALGHVNRLMALLAFLDGASPNVGFEIKNGDKTIGTVTSLVQSIRMGCPIGMGMLRRGHHRVGTEFETEFGLVKVIEAANSGGD